MLTPPPGDYAGQLFQEMNGTHSDPATADIAKVTAAALYFLEQASIRGGVTEPATIRTVVEGLSSAAYMTPHLLGQLGQWLLDEIRAGRIADSRDRRAWELEDELRAAVAEASDHAEHLMKALNTIQAHVSTLSPRRGDEQ